MPLLSLYLLLSLSLLAIAQNISGVESDGWDDFANNLASDLAPLLTLFGEPVTKQFMSESIYFIDYAIFAIAPIGIITALVSAIRVCGSSSSRAFIGKAQEGTAVAEAELCSSTSHDVGEVYTNGGIARVFGQPTLLEVIYVPGGLLERSGGGPSSKRHLDKVFTFEEFYRLQGSLLEWRPTREVTGASIQKTLGHLALYPPNLSLNVGIKRRPTYVSWMVAVLGVSLQVGLLTFASFATYVLRWPKDGKAAERYAYPLAFAGTVLLAIGAFLCAFLVGRTTREHVFERMKIPTASSVFYWLQPGNQRLGDQVYPSFAYTDRGSPLLEYVRSVKDSRKNSPLLVFATVFVTVAGFVTQFVGLRGLHSSIAIAQLGVTMLMTFIRCIIRTSRIDSEDNLLAGWQSAHGHELDWLAMRMVNDSPGTTTTTTTATTRSDIIPRPVAWWDFGRLAAKDMSRPVCFGSERDDHGQRATSTPPLELLSVRAQLALITSTDNSTARYFDKQKVPARPQAQRLCSALEKVVAEFASLVADGVVVLKRGRLFKHLRWSLAGSVGTSGTNQPGIPDQAPASEVACLRFEDREGWKLLDPEIVEAILGLRVWSLINAGGDQGSGAGVDANGNASGGGMEPGAPAGREKPENMIAVTSDKGILTQLHAWMPSAPGSPEQPFDLLHKLLPRALVHDTLDPDGNVLPGSRFTNLRRACNFHEGYLVEPLPHAGSEPRRATVFGWHAATSPETASRSRVFYLEPAGSASVLSLCAQELFGALVADLMKTVEHAGEVDIKRTRRPGLPYRFSLETPLVTALMAAFEGAGLGKSDAAVKCILPSVIPHLECASLAVVRVARALAERHQQEGRWREAENMLRWAWNIVTTKEVYMWDCTDDAEARQVETLAQERLLVAICELYRLALSVNPGFSRDHFELGLHWLEQSLKTIAESQDRHPLPWQVRRRYAGVLETIGHIKRQNSDHELWMSKIRDRPSPMDRMTILASLSVSERNVVRETQLADRRYLVEEAIKKDWPEVVLALLAASPAESIDGPDNNRGEWLRLAVKSGAHMTVSAILLAGASSAHRDGNGQQPIHHAAQQEDRTEVLWALLERATRFDQDSKGRTALSYAAERGNDRMISLLIHGRALRYNTNAVYDSRNGLETKDVDGLSPLHHAVLGGHEASAKTILRASSDTLERDLRHASKRGTVALVKLILGSGASPRPVSVDAHGQRNGNTALLLAAMNGHREVAELLLQHGASVKASNRLYWEPLFLAVEKGDEPMMKLLLDHGASQSSRLSPQRRAPNIFQHTMFPSNALCLAASKGHAGAVKLLLDHGADVNASAVTRRVHGAALLFAKSAEVVKLLVERGADIYATEGTGSTVLHLAARRGDRESCRLLIGAGLYIYGKDRRGRTVIDSVGLDVTDFSESQARELKELMYKWQRERMQSLPGISGVDAAAAPPSLAPRDGSSSRSRGGGGEAPDEGEGSEHLTDGTGRNGVVLDDDGLPCYSDVFGR